MVGSMLTVLLVVHLLIVIALVGIVLLQRSEGGGLGIGGGSNGFMSARGTANVLTRTTAILAALFFVTSIGLSVLPHFIGGNTLNLNVAKPAAATAPADAAPAAVPALPTNGQGALGLLKAQAQQKAGDSAPAQVPPVVPNPAPSKP